MDLALDGRTALVTGSTAGIGHAIARRLALEGAETWITGRTAWTRLFELNVMSGVRLSRAYLPKMLAANAGRIVFISSESALQIPSEMIHYGVSKTAQVALGRGLAELTTGTQVTVNSILVGPTRSEGVEGFIQQLAGQRGVTEQQAESDFFTTARPTSLLRRFITTDEVANVVAFVVSPLAAAVNGAALRADGGVVRSAF